MPKASNPWLAPLLLSALVFLGCRASIEVRDGVDASLDGTADAGGDGDGGGGDGDVSDGGGGDGDGDGGDGDGGGGDDGCPALDAPVGSSAGHPNMYLNAGELAALRAHVAAGDEPWKSAYDAFMSRVDDALAQPPKSVRESGSTSADYYSEAPYCGWGSDSPCGGSCCDGQINPNADRGDYSLAIDIGRAIRDLGLAYALTDDAQYADHAIALINHFAVDPDTRMTPAFANSQSEIELSITIPGMFYGGDLIWNYPGWSSSDRDAFVNWASEFAENVRGRSAEPDTNNFGDWRLVFLASAAAFTEDAELMTYVIDHFKAMLPYQIDGNGAWIKEKYRTRALHYSLYAANAVAQVCEIARHFGENLYDFAASDGRGDVKKGFSYLAPYVRDPAGWPDQQIDALTKDDAVSFELAYAAWGDQTFVDVFDAWGRPHYDIRTAGPLTLTHARGSYDFSYTTDAFRVAIGSSSGGEGAPLELTFDASASLSPSAITGYSWDFGDGGSSDASAPTHTYSEPGCYSVTLELTNADGDTARGQVLVRPSLPGESALGSLESSGGWQRATFDAVTGTATIELDAVASGVIDGVLGVSSGSASEYAGLAAIVRFNPQGTIDVRDGDTYAAAETFSYPAGEAVHLRIELDVSAHTYDVFATADGGEVQLADDYGFRSEQASVTSLDHFNVFSGEGTLTLSNIVVAD